MRSFTSPRPVWSASSTARAACTSRCSSERVPHGMSSTVSSHVRIQLCSGLCSLIRSSRSISRSTAVRTSSGTDAASSRARYSSTTSPSSPVALAQLLADGLELLAQHELALRLLHALGDAAADLLAHLELGEHLARPAQRLLDALLGIEGLEQLDLALDRQVGRPAGGVGQRAGVVDALEHVGDAGRADALARCRARSPCTRGAISRPRPEISLRSATGSTCTHTPVCSLGAGCPTWARARPRSTRARWPFGSSPSLSTRAMVPTVANAPDPVRGTRSRRPSASAAPSAASRASGDSRASVTTICGRTTPLWSGSSGRVKVSVSALVIVVSTNSPPGPPGGW